MFDSSLCWTDVFLYQQQQGAILHLSTVILILVGLLAFHFRSYLLSREIVVMWLEVQLQSQLPTAIRVTQLLNSRVCSYRLKISPWM